MSKSTFWGFEVSHIVGAFGVLAASNVLLNIFGAPLFLSWVFGLGTLFILRVISHGQKNGHLELLLKYLTDPHVYLGHKERTK
jgi:hypothetical protein